MVNNGGKLTQLVFVADDKLDFNLLTEMVFQHEHQFLLEVFIGKVSFDELSEFVVYFGLERELIDPLSTHWTRLIDMLDAPHTEPMAALQLARLYHDIEANRATAVYFELVKFFFRIIDHRSFISHFFFYNYCARYKIHN